MFNHNHLMVTQAFHNVNTFEIVQYALCPINCYAIAVAFDFGFSIVNGKRIIYESVFNLLYNI